MSKLAELREHVAGGVSRIRLSPGDAHLTVREHIQAGGRFKDHRVAQAVVRALNMRDEITDPEILAKAEAKLFELLKSDPIEGVTVEPI